MADGPHAPAERTAAARGLLQQPLTCRERDVELFQLIRSHATDLDRWFTQRLGYRLHVDADTARLYKSGAVLDDRRLRTRSDRPLTQREHVLLALVLAATAAGPAVISLRDLVDDVRSAAADAFIELSGDGSERRALVTVLRWMIDHGLAVEQHAHIDDYATDETADAVLKVRPDRIALLALPALVSATSAGELTQRADRRANTRQWLRTRLVEDPVVYRDDLSEAEWNELRRRLGDEERMLGEMFGLLIEARSEGVAAIDPSGKLSAVRFPASDTVGHASLLLLDFLRPCGPAEEARRLSEVVDHIAELAVRHAPHWSDKLVGSPSRLAKLALALLVDLRLVEIGDELVRPLPAAARFVAVDPPATADGDVQRPLW